MATTHSAGGHTLKLSLVALIVLGGAAVLGSYAHGLGRPDAARFWGGVPEALQPVYTFSMFGAALGFFPFTSYVLLRLDPASVRIGRFGFPLLLGLYALILIPSALWMPLTFVMLDAPSLPLWWTIRGVLALVALGSLGLLAALLVLEPRDRGPFWAAAVAGAILFCNQTVLLDAIVWPAFFPL